jgi:hypothetical protein
VANPITPIFDLLGIELEVVTLKGVVSLSGIPVSGAKVLYYNLDGEFGELVETDMNGEYLIDTCSKGSNLVISAHYESGGKVFSSGTQIKLITMPEETLNFALSEYDAVPDGQIVNFKFYGLDWLTADLLLEKYSSVWY